MADCWDGGRMTMFIAHRGNIAGADPKRENTQEYMEEAISAGYGVEVDIHWDRGVLYYGHDHSSQPVDDKFITKRDVFCHAKNIEAIPALMALGCNVFVHQTDPCVYTSKGHVWCYPGIHVKSDKAIWLDLHGEPLPADIPSKLYGICGDDAAVMSRVKN
jgi:hypothetical protein